MAVVQISKIQIRRGLKDSSSGVPQLSSAELAWAVDSQELYIGNGSVAEGAPFVGNTKVLTEHDNILELASSYQFASDDPSITLSTPRALLGKIDEIQVSVADFGAVGDGSTDNVEAFETAFTQLFRNVDENYQKVLYVPNGEYNFLSDLEIPSNTIIRGETQGKAILKLDTHNIRFITSNGSGLLNFNSSNRPENIEISNLTILRSSGQTVITGLKNSKFINVLWKGEYVLGNVVSSLSTEPAAVFWNNDTTGIKLDGIIFDDCEFNSNSLSLKCSQAIQTETRLTIKNSKFFVNDTGIYISGVSGQTNAWNILNNDFEEMATQVFYSTNGFGTKIQNCNFKSCGNGTGNSSSPTNSIITFGESRNNTVIQCVTDRQQDAAVVTSELIDAVPEVTNSDNVSFVNRNFSNIFKTDSPSPVAVFSAIHNFIKLNYVLRLGDHIRYGTINFTVGDDKSKLSYIDNYSYSDVNTSSPGGVVMTNFEFSALLRDNDSDSGIETIVLYYKNPIATGATGTLSFDVSYGV